MTRRSATHYDYRKSGIAQVGRVPRGSHFCQFYENTGDLYEIFVPFFKAGLKNNELCTWVIAPPLEPEEVQETMAKAIPGFKKYLSDGQMEIVSLRKWRAGRGKSGKSIAARVDEAIIRGFDSVRFGFSGCPARPDQPAELPYPEAALIGFHNAVAIFAYPRSGFNATAIMEIVKRHQCALVRNAGAWEVIRSSEFKRTQDALRKSDQRYASLFDNMLDGYAYCRMIFQNGQPEDFEYLAVNSSFVKLTGLEDVVGKRVTEVIPGIKESNPELFQTYGRVVLTGQPERFEVYLPPLGKWLTISVYSPEKGHFVAVFDDITERKITEENIRRQNSIVSAINRVFRESFACETEEDLAHFCLNIIVDLTGSEVGFVGEIGLDGFLHDIAMNNPAWEVCAMQDKAGHRRLPGSFKIHGLYGRVLKDSVSLISNEPNNHQDSIGTPAGHPPLKSFLGVPLVYGGQIRGMVGLANRPGGYHSEELEFVEALAPAVAEALMHKQAEIELKHYSTELEFSNEELESFSYTVSHDLRAPLRSIDGLSKILSEDYADKLDDQGQDYLRRTRAASQLMAQLIDDILQLARVTRAGFTGQRVNLSNLVAKVSEDIQNTQPERQVEWIIQPDVQAYGDVSLLRLMLENLLNNAFKYSSKRPDARIEFGKLEHNGEQLYFVRDNGVGFDMAYVKELFQPFHRLHSASEFPGTGVGLATVKRIVQRHGGRVWAEGQVDKGTTIHFTLNLNGK